MGHVFWLLANQTSLVFYSISSGPKNKVLHTSYYHNGKYLMICCYLSIFVASVSLTGGWSLVLVLLNLSLSHLRRRNLLDALL